MFQLTNTLNVDFTAKRLHVDASGRIWAYLANGMTCSIGGEASTTTIDHFSSKRFHDPFWVNDVSYQVDFGEQLQASHNGRLQNIRSLSGASWPIVISPDRSDCFYANAGVVNHVKLVGDQLYEHRMGFDVGCLQLVSATTLWVGGDSVSKLDLNNGSIQTLDSKRATPYLSVASHETNELVAFAGGDISIYSTGGTLKNRFGDNYIACGLTKSGILIAYSQGTTQSNKLRIRAEGETEVCEVFGRGFASYQDGVREKLVVSDDSKLFFYEKL